MRTQAQIELAGHIGYVVNQIAPASLVHRVYLEDIRREGEFVHLRELHARTSAEMERCGGKIPPAELLNPFAKEIEKESARRIRNLFDAHAETNSWYAKHRDAGLATPVEEFLASESKWRTAVSLWPQRGYNAALREMAPTLGDYPVAQSKGLLNQTGTIASAIILGGGFGYLSHDVLAESVPAILNVLLGVVPGVALSGYGIDAVQTAREQLLTNAMFLDAHFSRVYGVMVPGS